MYAILFIFNSASFTLIKSPNTIRRSDENHISQNSLSICFLVKICQWKIHKIWKTEEKKSLLSGSSCWQTRGLKKLSDKFLRIPGIHATYLDCWWELSRYSWHSQQLQGAFLRTTPFSATDWNSWGPSKCSCWDFLWFGNDLRRTTSFSTDGWENWLWLPWPLLPLLLLWKIK